MLLNPLEKEALVKQADVQIAILPNTLIGKEPPEADAVVEVDKDNAPAGFSDDLRPVVVGVAVPDVA